MLYGCIFCPMSPGNLGALGTHLRLFVDEYAEGHRNGHDSHKSAFATKVDHVHHVGMIRCWIGGRQTNVRIPAVRAVQLAYSKDPVEHATLWRFAKNVDVELQDSEAEQWKGRDTTITAAWWDQGVRDVMAGITSSTAVVRESRIRAGVPTIGKVTVPTGDENFTSPDDELEFGEWNPQMDVAFPAPRQLVQHGDFSAGHRISGESNEIVNTTAGTANDIVTMERSTTAGPSTQRRSAAAGPSTQRPAQHDKSLRSRGPVGSPAPLPAEPITIDDENDTEDLPSRRTRTRTRKRAGSGSAITEYDETHGTSDYHPPSRRQREQTVHDEDSDAPAPKQRTRNRAPPPPPFTLNVDVLGKFVMVPVTPYHTLAQVITAAFLGAGKPIYPPHAIRGSEPLVRIDASSFMLIDEWCQQWDEVIWARIKEKAAFLPQPVMWTCEIVEVRGKKKAGKA